MMKLIFHISTQIIINWYTSFKKAFANGSSANLIFSKIQLSKIQTGRILGELLVAI